MRLIDADELSIIKEKLRIFDSFISSITRQYTDEHQTIYEHWIDCRYDIENAIDEFSTAYDVDAVVKESEKKLSKLLHICALEDVDRVNNFYDSLEETIRKGGVE